MGIEPLTQLVCLVQVVSQHSKLILMTVFVVSWRFSCWPVGSVRSVEPLTTSSPSTPQTYREAGRISWESCGTVKMNFAPRQNSNKYRVQNTTFTRRVHNWLCCGVVQVQYDGDQVHGVRQRSEPRTGSPRPVQRTPRDGWYHLRK